MKSLLATTLTTIIPLSLLLAADPQSTPPLSPSPAGTPTPAPVQKIIPGKVIVPLDQGMRRIWGELVSLDLKTRTGTFRKESTNEIMPFTVLPYAELLHHASFGDLQDFRIGTRAIFRLHQNDATSQWTWLTYIQDEMNFLNGHKEYYYVDRIDPEKGELECTDARGDGTFTRKKGIIIKTDKDTAYWKQGQPAAFSDIKIGDKLRTETHGIGKGEVHLCWNVFLDDESLQKFQTEQKARESQRLLEEGSPGYVDQLAGANLDLVMFQESGELSHKLKSGMKVKVAPAGVDRKPTAPAVSATVSSASPIPGNLVKLSVTLDSSTTSFPVGDVARVWENK